MSQGQVTREQVERRVRSRIVNQGKIFFAKVHKKFNGRFEYPGEYVGRKKPIEVRCKIHNETFSLWADKHYRSQFGGCKKCFYENQSKNRIDKAAKSFAKKANKKHNSFFDYSLVDYKGNDELITIICPVHGPFDQLPRVHLEGFGCRQCSAESNSKGVQKIIETLATLGIVPILEKRFPDCRHKIPLPFDFFLPKYNILIEYDGKEHFLEGRAKDLKGIQKRDKIKDEWAAKSIYTLVRIPYTEFNNIESIINSLL